MVASVSSQLQNSSTNDPFNSLDLAANLQDHVMAISLPHGPACTGLVTTGQLGTCLDSNYIVAVTQQQTLGQLNFDATPFISLNSTPLVALGQASPPGTSRLVPEISEKPTSSPLVTPGLVSPTGTSQLSQKGPLTRDQSRSVVDIMRDHTEVETVLHGGVGTKTVVPQVWQLGQLQPIQLANCAESADPLPFASCDIPTEFSVPAKPVAKTSHLKEFKINYYGKSFTDRILPPPAQTLVAHPRFTPTYYVALHNLAACAGRDGNGFGYPANTPNYRGARIPLAHTGLKISNWRRLLTGYGEDNELLQFMEFGFPLGLVDTPVLSACERNHGSSYQYFPHIDKFIAAEITRGGLTGPFTHPPWSNLMLSPMMTAPKKPNSRRPVFDATFGDHSLNNATPSDHYLGTPTVYTYPKIDDFKRIILSCGRNCFMWKRDLHRFYLQIPLDPVDYQHVGCIWRGIFFIFVMLMFGLRHSGLQGQRLTDALSWIHRQLGLDSTLAAKYNCINYCDDLGGAESSKSRADESFQKLVELLEELGLQEAKDKASSPSTEMTYLGVLFNSNTMTMSVPPEKLAELKAEIERWYRKTTTAKKPLQSLLGKLFWVSRVVQHSRTFMGRLLAQLRELSGKPDCMKVKLSDDCRKDLLWWRNFLQIYNGVTMIENDSAIPLSLSQLLDKPHTICVGDATLTGGGAWHGSCYWSRQFPLKLRDPKIPVHIKEFLVVIVSVKLWGEGWAGKVIQIFCDNDPVCDVVDGERPSDPAMLSLLREFKYLVCRYKFYPIMRKINTKDNLVADHISRRHEHSAALVLFNTHGLGNMTLVEAPDRLFDMTAPW